MTEQFNLSGSSGITRESIKGAPEFDATALVNREYEKSLYDYYGRPKYWD